MGPVVRASCRDAVLRAVGVIAAARDDVAPRAVPDVEIAARARAPVVDADVPVDNAARDVSAPTREFVADDVRDVTDCVFCMSPRDIVPARESNVVLVVVAVVRGDCGGVDVAPRITAAPSRVAQSATPTNKRHAATKGQNRFISFLAY